MQMMMMMNPEQKAMSCETGLCAVHGKNRSLDTLQDNGAGGLCCIPGKECKVAGMTKNIPCTFWQAGKCTKGENCGFSHEFPVGAWPEDGGKGSWGGYGYGGYAGKGADMGWMSKGMAMKGKGSYGKSVFGGGCGGYGGYGGYADFGGYGKSKGGYFCAVHQKLRSAHAVMELGDGTFQCKPDSECKGFGGSSKMKTAMCRFFLENKCTKGASCTFAHSAEEIGTPVPEGAQTCRFTPY